MTTVYFHLDKKASRKIHLVEKDLDLHDSKCLPNELKAILRLKSQNRMVDSKLRRELSTTLPF